MRVTLPQWRVASRRRGFTAPRSAAVQLVLSFLPRTVGRRGAVSLPPPPRERPQDGGPGALPSPSRGGGGGGGADDEPQGDHGGVRLCSSMAATLQLALASPHCVARDASSRTRPYGATAAAARTVILFLRQQHFGRLSHGHATDQLRCAACGCSSCGCETVTAAASTLLLQRRLSMCAPRDAVDSLSDTVAPRARAPAGSPPRVCPRLPRSCASARAARPPRPTAARCRRGRATPRSSRRRRARRRRARLRATRTQRTARASHTAHRCPRSARRGELAAAAAASPHQCVREGD